MLSAERPEGALMAARRLVGHAIFGLEVRLTPEKPARGSTYACM
jgi:hypothetical protein